MLARLQYCKRHAKITILYNFDQPRYEISEWRVDLEVQNKFVDFIKEEEAAGAFETNNER